MIRNKWLNLFLLYLGGVTISLSQLKVIPIQATLHQSLGWSFSQIAWLMSIFTISGILLAIFGGILVTKYGEKRILVLIMGCTIIGNLLGASTNNYLILLLSRLIEGIAFSMIIMIGIVFINDWFKAGHSGIATGIWGTFSAAGSLISMNIFLPLAKNYGIKAPWLLVALLALILLIVYSLLIAAPDKTKLNQFDAHLMKAVTKNRNVWLLAFAQGCMALVLFSFINTYPLIYTQQYHLTVGVANRYTGFFGLFGIPFGAVAGYLIDKTKKSLVITAVSFLIMTIGALLSLGLVNPTLIVIQLFVLSMGTGLSSACIMIIAPSLTENKQLIGMIISLINFIYYVGIFIGTPITTYLASFTHSWTLPIIMLTLVSLIGVILVFYFIWVTTKYSDKKKKEAVTNGRK